jgi:DNA transposition AAA+ family ATPase
MQTITPLDAPPSQWPKHPESQGCQVVEASAHKREQLPEPTPLLLIDDTARLQTAGLEQGRDIFAHGGIGVGLIGMPGGEKRLARYPQFYARVGVVYALRPLRADGVRDVFQRPWVPTGVKLPHAGLHAEDVLAASIRITGGTCRFLHRLLTQVARLLESNALSRGTREVVEAARESLVIGAV